MADVVANPYVGPRTFTYAERERFFGREREAQDLLSLVISERLVLFYAQSGAGKSSLLNTRLAPQLTEAGYAVLPVARVGGELPEGVSDVDNIFIFNCLLHLDQRRGDPCRFAHMTLTDFLPRLTSPDGAYYYYDDNAEPVEDADAYEEPLHVLILDQFEEIVTTHLERWQERAAFFRQLEEAMAADPLLWVVLTLREDYVAPLDPYAGLLSNHLRARFYMQRMGYEAALEAVRRPAQQYGRPFAPGVAETLVDNLRQMRVRETTAPGLGQFIEPVQLQVVCYQLWENLQDREAGEITAQDLQQSGDVDTALASFYEEALASVLHDRRVSGVSEMAVRNWFNRQLITEAGTRGMVYRGETHTAELPNLVVQLLEGRYVLRSEIRSGGVWYELVHDRLIEPVRKNNAMWFESQLSALQRQADIWHRNHRQAGFLLTGEALADAERWAAAHAAELTDIETDFLSACRAVREQAERERQLNRRNRRLAIGIIMAVIAFIAVGISFFSQNTKAAAQIQLQTALSLQLGARSPVNLDVRAPHSLLLALEAIAITQKVGAFSAVTSRQLLNDVLSATGGIPLHHAAPVVAVGFSPDDHWLATASANTTQLWDMHVPSAVPILLRHDKVVNALAFSPNKHTLATVGDDASVRLWDISAADRAASMRVLTGHSAPIVDVAFSRSGRWLATASKDGTARLWDLAAADPATASSILPHEQGVQTLAFSPDNRWLATGTGSADGMVRLWDLLSPNPSAGPIHLHANPDVRKVAFSPNSQWLVAGDTESYTVELMRVMAPDQPFFLKVNQWVGAVAFSPDGRWLATPSQYNALLWDLNKSDPSIEPLILPGHKYYIADLAFSPDGQWFATGSGDHTVRLWNMADRSTPPAVLRGHEGPVSRVAFSHDNRHLATASVDQTVRLWNISSPAAEPLALRTPDGSPGMHMWDMRAVDLPAAPRILGEELDPGAGSVFSPDGQWLATIPSGENVDVVHLWNLSTPSPTHYLVRHEGGIWASPVFSPDGRWLATGGVGDPTIRLWDLKAPDPTSSPQVLPGHRGPGHRRPVRSLAFSADGHRLVTGANDGLALVWNLIAADPSASPRSLAGGGGTSIVHTVAISRDGRYVVTGSWEPDYAARIWDLSIPVSPSNPITLTFKGRLDEVAFSADGRWVAAGSWDFTTQLLDLTKPGAKPFVLQGHTARTLSVTFSPDNRWLATGNEDQTARLWDLAATDPSADSIVLQAAYRVGNVSFSPDGRWLALNATSYLSNSFSPDGHWFASSSTDTRLFHLRLEDLILLACRTAGRNLTQKEWEQSFGDKPYRKTCRQMP